MFENQFEIEIMKIENFEMKFKFENFDFEILEIGF